jgi:hypothetical protein
MSPFRNLVRQEQGIAMVLVVSLAALLSVLGLTLLETVRSESKRSSHAVWKEEAFHAAEAGLDDYIAKLLDDHLYYVHQVHPGEATRRALPGGETVSAGNAWTHGLSWEYPNGKDGWRQLSNGYEYNVQIAPPTAGQQGVKIIATGRKVGGSTTDWRVIEASVRPSSVADFQMLANRDIVYGTTATTYGKIYAGIDSSNVRHNVTHFGTAHANIYAESNVYGPPTLLDGAQTYNSTNIRTVIRNPINFNSFLTSLVDIQRASQVGGIYLDNPAADAFRLTFLSSGSVQVQTCTKSSARDVADLRPSCGSATVYSVPANGAIYVVQTAIVSGTVKGRVTVASNNNVVIADNISYVSSGNDVLGLVAKNEMIVAYWTPHDLNWRAATIAQSGAWHSWNTDGSHGTATFMGSTATNLGGYMNMFQTRVYQYDETLLWLQPPWFPTVEDAYTIMLFRELPGH